MTHRNLETQIGTRNAFPVDGDPGDPCLVVIVGPNIGEVFSLSKNSVIIGRDEAADIICDDILVSRKHINLLKGEDGYWTMIDCQSTNGSYLNFQRVDQSVLRSGDKISVGKVIFKFLDRDIVETNFHDELYSLSTIDGLTQIYRRSRFEEILEKTIQSERLNPEPTVLCMIDIDFFKKINDNYGHQAGDYVLRVLTYVIKQVIRREDVLARYGGEEFCLLLLNTSLEEGSFVAEKVRYAIESNVFEFEGQKIDVTVSIGVAVFSEELDSISQFISKADEKLYEAKRSGRNCVIF
ncbi:hypothetical protein AB834_05745 [PVC group bacterium (ex Bugula neritina AB1)]|nr:hypothetical protein AB834_05745 [PVC group bacterium (ex Bugula neritina AB1)]